MQRRVSIGRECRIVEALEYGIEQVSGFYGQWTRELASMHPHRCVLLHQTTYARDQFIHIKWTQLRGLDLNLITAYVRPITAAFDLILNMNRYFGSRERLLAIG